MKKKYVVSILIMILLLTLACEPLDNLLHSPNPTLQYEERVKALLTLEAEESGSAPADATPEPEYQPVIPRGSGDLNPETANAGTHEYSVEATNFNCTCQVNGNITRVFNFTGAQVEFPKADGTSQVYDKIGENTYKLTWMGYYILQNGSGAQATETKVDEERATVLIFSSSGYIMEAYQGTEETPCCYYTNTIVK